MPEREVKQLNIPPEAIRTMKKDLAGITKGEWELTLAEAELEELLRKFRDRQAREETAEEIEEKRKAMEERKRKAIEEQKRKEEEEEEKKEPAEIEAAKEEAARKAAEEISEKEKAAAEEIRRRAREREKVVKKRMEKEEDKKALEQERKMEEERKRKEEKELNKRLEELRRALKNIPKEKVPLEENRAYYLKEQAKIQKDLEPILESERKIEENIRFIEGIEKTAITPRQKKKAEQERQLAEQERETIEKQRWDYEQKKFKIDKQLKEIDFDFRQLAQKEAKIKQEIEDVSKELEKIEKRRERVKIEKRISQLAEEKKEYSQAKNEILEKRKEIEEKLAEIINREQKIEKETGYIESEEKLATETEKQRVEKERWKLQKLRSEIEKERWALEEQKRKIRLEENRINVHYDKILEQENQLRKRIEDINKLLGLAVPVEKPEPEPEAKEKEAKPEEAEKPEKPTEKEVPAPEALAKKAPGEPKEPEPKKEEPKLPTEAAERTGLVGARKLGPQKPKPIVTEAEEEKSGEKAEEKPKTEQEAAKEALEKIEAKKRREALLKKLRARRERDVEKKEKRLLQRIRQGVSMKERPPEKPAKVPLKERPPLMTVSPEALAKKARRRTLIIAASVIIIIGIGVFWYWYARVREAPTPAPVPTVTPTPTPLTAELPPALITVDTTIPHEIDSPDQILPFVIQVFQSANLPKNEFARMAIKDPKNNKYLGIQELLPALQLNPPQALYSQIDNEATFYVFPTNDYNVLGFVAQSSPETERADIEQTMGSWETGLIAQTKALGLALGKTNIVPIAGFQEEDYNNEIKVRFLTLVPGPDCYGLCYTVLDNNLLLATCCEPIIEIIEKNLIEGLEEGEPTEPSPKTELQITESMLGWGYRIPSTARSIDTIVVHSSYDALGPNPYSTDGVIEEYRQYKVAPHYLIARNGTIFHLAPEEAIAYHAGVSEMPDGRDNVNNFSIGIELIYTKSDTPNEAQYQSLILLVKSLRERYNIPISNIVGHEQISPGRKPDDPANFDWEKLRQALQ